MGTWYRKSPEAGSSYVVFNNGSTQFSTTGTWMIKYVDDSGCVTESEYVVTRCCTCGDFSASKSSVSFGSGGGEDTVTFNLIGSCSGSLSDLTCTSSDSWITTGFNSSHSALTITVGSYSDYDTNRTGHTVVSYGDCNVVNIEVVQEKVIPGACTCDDLSVGSSPDDIPATGGSAEVTWSLPSTCQGTVGVSSDESWCHVTTGNGVFNITVDNYPYSSGVTDRTATITPTVGGVDCTTKEFTVTQLAPEPPACTCGDFSASKSSLSFASGGGSDTVKFSKTGDCTGNLTSLTPSTNDSWITPTFNSSHDTLTIAVDTYSDYDTNRTGHTVVSYGDCNVVNIEVVQEKATPGACTCDNLSVGSSPAAIAATGGSATVTWEFTGSCTSVSVTPSVPASETSWCHVTAGNGVFNITVDNYPYSSGVTDRSATITPLLGESGVACTSGEFTVTQSAPEPPTCTCNDFSASKNSVSFGSEGGSGTVTFSKTGDCTGNLTSLTVSTNDSWITPTFNNSHNTLTITVGSYSDYDTNRTGHTVVSYGDCNVVDIEVVQEKATPGACTCDNLSVGSSPAAIAATGGSAEVTWEFTGSCTSVLVTPSVPVEATWCHVTTGNGVFNITVDNYPYSSGVTDRSVTVTPLLGESRVPCTSREFTVTQSAPTPECSCDNFSILSSRDFPSSGGTSGIIGGWWECSPDVASKPDWVTVRFEYGNSIWVDAAENTSSGSREGFVVFSYNGVLCENKKLKVTQEGATPPVKCYNITPTTGNCSGGTVGFTATEISCN